MPVKWKIWQLLNGKFPLKDSVDINRADSWWCFILQVEEEMEELKEMYRRRPKEEESHIRSPQKKNQVDAYWQETLQRFHTAQKLGNNYVHTVTTVTRPPWIRSSDEIVHESDQSTWSHLRLQLIKWPD